VRGVDDPRHRERIGAAAGNDDIRIREVEYAQPGAEPHREWRIELQVEDVDAVGDEGLNFLRRIGCRDVVRGQDRAADEALAEDVNQVSVDERAIEGAADSDPGRFEAGRLRVGQ
jgi:hypothetical protein